MYYTTKGQISLRWRYHTTLPTRAPYVLAEPKLPYIYGERTKFFRPKVTVSTKTSKPQVSSQLPIHQAIANAFNSKRILKIQYRNASGYVAEREIDILALGNNYIDAYDHLKNEPRTFKIDRIFNLQ
ncbi:WYL domain-containing protein [Chloroflexota bacterium]